MKKIAIGIVLILAIAACCMPFVNGIIMEKGFNRCLDELNRMYTESGTNASATLVRYERGFLNSEIEWKLNLGDLKALYGIDEIILLERAEHGFTDVTSYSSLEKNDWYLKFIEEKLGGKEPVSLVTTYAVTGDIHSEIDISAFSLAVEDQTIEVQPGSMSFDTDLQLDSFVMTGDWGGAAIPGTVAMNNVAFSSDVTKISTYIWEGVTALRVASITAEEQAQKIAMTDLSVEYGVEYDQEKKALAIEALYGVEEISDGVEKVENATVTIGAKGVDGAAYEEAMRLYLELAGKLFTDISTVGDDPKALERVLQDKMMNYGLQLMAIYEKFLKEGFEVYVKDMSATLPQGDLSGGVVLKMKKDLTMAQIMPMMNDPEMIFEYLDYTSDFVMPSVLAENKAQMITPLLPGMSKGFFVEEGETLKHHAETREQKLYLNGEQVNLNY
ncbi:DUF945 family protein [Desulfosediminicola ganghwensis]|uniref:DUF945 family protein n=1 Tax=Desulfosediminicola ganghwensis TaxID=2569540 RepID=UPI0010AD1309|nr:DUF945 family protein [Desulfosediminicola ganghwensis]